MPALGLKEGLVIDNVDPENSGRLKIEILNRPPEWAMPCVPFAGDGRGFYVLPQNGDTVWVAFQDDDWNLPVWIGSYWKGLNHLKYVDNDRTISFIRTDDIEISFGSGGIKFTSPDTIDLHAEKYIVLNTIEDNIEINAARQLRLLGYSLGVLLHSQETVEIEGKSIELKGWPLKFKSAPDVSQKITELENRIAALEAGGGS